MPTFQERDARLGGGGGEGGWFIETIKSFDIELLSTFIAPPPSPHSSPGLPTERRSRVVLLIDSDIPFDDRCRASARDRWRLRLDV